MISDMSLLTISRGATQYFYLESILKEGLPCTDTEMNPLIVLIVLKSVQYWCMNVCKASKSFLRPTLTSFESCLQKICQHFCRNVFAYLLISWECNLLFPMPKYFGWRTGTPFKIFYMDGGKISLVCTEILSFYVLFWFGLPGSPNLSPNLVTDDSNYVL